MKQKVKKYNICILLIVAFSQELFAQQFADKKFYLVDSLKLENVEKANRELLDSSLHIYHKIKNDTEQIIVINNLVEGCWDENVWPRYNNWVYENVKRRLASALQHFSARELFFYKRTLATAINNKGFLFSKHGDYNSALKEWELSLQLRTAIKDEKGVANSLNNIASVHENLGNIPLALDYYHRSLKIREEIKDLKGTASTLNNIGAIYMNQGDVDKALEYWQKCLSLRQQSGDKNGEAISLNNLAGVFQKQGKSRQALEYYFKALQINRAIANKAGEAVCFRNIAHTYENMAEENEKNPEKNALRDSALSYVKKSLSIREEMGDKKGIAASLSNLGLIYFHQGRFPESEKCGTRALEIARQIKAPMSIREAASLLYKTYKKENKGEKAFEMFELWVTMRDSIASEENKKAGIKSELKYEYDKKSAADSVKNAEQQKVKDAQLTAQTARLKQERTQFWFLIGGLVFVVCGLVFVINRFRITQKQKKIIELQKKHVDGAFEKLHEKNKEVLDSIHYARRIQRALITSEYYINKNINRLNK